MVFPADSIARVLAGTPVCWPLMSPRPGRLNATCVSSRGVSEGGLLPVNYGWQAAVAHPINRLWVAAGVLETAKAENTEIRFEPGRTHKILRLNPRPITRRLAQVDANPIAGGPTSTQTQTSPKTLAKLPKLPKRPGHYRLRRRRVSEGPALLSRRKSAIVLSFEVASGNCGNGGNSRELDKTGIGGHRDRESANCGNCANSAAAGATSPKPSYTAPWSGRTKASCCRDGRTARTG